MVFGNFFEILVESLNALLDQGLEGEVSLVVGRHVLELWPQSVVDKLPHLDHFLHAEWPILGFNRLKYVLFKQLDYIIKIMPLAHHVHELLILLLENLLSRISYQALEGVEVLLGSFQGELI